MTVEDRFVETLSEVPATCLEENDNGHKCVKREDHDGPHKAAGPYVSGVYLWDEDGVVGTRDADESTLQTELVPDGSESSGRASLRDPEDDPFACSICGEPLGTVKRVEGEDYCDPCLSEMGFAVEGYR